MARLPIGTIFFSVVILLVTTHANADLDEALVFYLDFDNVTKVWTILRDLRVLESNTLFCSIDCESVHLS